MSDTTRTLLIALGVALLVVVLVPLLFMSGMMAPGMTGGMMGGGMMGGGAWIVLVVVLVAGVVLLALGLRSGTPRGER